MKTILFLLLTFLYTYKGYTQDGPGGFGDTSTSSTRNIILWLNANEISQADATTISTWNDDSSEGNNATSPSGSEPTFETNTMNGYPTIRFTAANSDYLTIPNDASLNPNRISYFIVGSYTTDTSDLSPFLIKTTNNNWADGYGFVKDNLGDSFSTYVENKASNFSDGDLTPDTNYIIHSSYNENNLRLRYNDINQGNPDIVDSYTASSSPLLIGISPDSAGTGFEEPLDGDIAEIIVVNTQMRSSWRKIISNYLSAKYNITIRAAIDDYTMDDTANGDYDHNVAGIGNQTSNPTGANKIETSKGTGIVEISNASSLDNGDYLYWGENIKDANYDFSTTSNYLERIDTKWRVSEVGDVGTVTMSFDTSSIDLTGKQACADLTLVVSNDNFVSNRTEYTLTISGTTATATGVSLADADYFTLEYIDKIVLDGTTFYNGSGTGNAPNTSDSCYKLLITSATTGATTLTENAHVREVEVETGGNLAVSTGNYIEIDNNLQLDGDIRLVGNAQLIQNHIGTEQVSGAGHLYIDQASNIASANSIYRYTYWSSPVINADGDTTFSVEDVMKDGTNPTTALGGASEAQDITFISYDGSIATANGSPSDPITIANYWINTYKEGTDNSGFTQQLETGNIDIGLGYLMKGTGRITGQNYSFVGTPNDGDITVNIASSATSTILGNPYPSAINANQFMLDNSSVIRQEIYFWQHQGEISASEGHNQSSYYGGYSVLNMLTSVVTVQPGTGSAGPGTFTYDLPGSYIPVGQGFLIIADNTGDITFQNSQRAYQALRGDSPSGSSFFFGRGNTSNRENNTPILRLGFEHNNQFGVDLHRQIVVGFKEGLTFSFENGFDTRMIDSRLTEIFWNFPSDENRYIITGVQEFNKDLEIPIGLTIGEEKPIYFMIDEKKNIDEDVFLKDELTGQFFNLSETVELNLPVGNYTDRFFITFQESSVLNTNDFLTEKIICFYDSSTKELVIEIKENTKIDKVHLYNTLGKKVLEKTENFNFLNNQTRIKIKNTLSGIYIIKIKTDKGIISKKVIIH